MRASWGRWFLGWSFLTWTAGDLWGGCSRLQSKPGMPGARELSFCRSRREVRGGTLSRSLSSSILSGLFTLGTSPRSLSPGPRLPCPLPRSPTGT